MNEMKQHWPKRCFCGEVVYDSATDKNWENQKHNTFYCQALGHIANYIKQPVVGREDQTTQLREEYNKLKEKWDEYINSQHEEALANNKFLDRSEFSPCHDFCEHRNWPGIRHLKCSTDTILAQAMRAHFIHESCHPPTMLQRCLGWVGRKLSHISKMCLLLAAPPENKRTYGS